MSRFEICLLVGLVIGFGLTIMFKILSNQGVISCLFTGLLGGLGVVFIPVFTTNYFTSTPDKLGVWLLGLWLAGSVIYAIYVTVHHKSGWLGFTWGFFRGSAVAAGLLIFIIVAFVGSFETPKGNDPYDDYWD